MPTPPKGQTGGSAATTGSQVQTQSQNALAFVDQLETYVSDLKRELRSYGDANTVGRDTAGLRTSFGRIHQCELQIAEAMGIDWSPSSR